jgi:hypothetical protein
MLATKSVIIFLLFDISKSLAFVCNPDSNENSDIDFERLESFDWKIVAKLEGKKDIERPFGFPLHKLMTVNMILSKTDKANLTSEVFTIEIHCDQAYEVLMISKVLYQDKLVSRPVVNFCSLSSSKIWTKVHFNYDYYEEMLIIYFCNSDVDFVVVFVKGKLDQVQKKKITQKTLKILEQHSSSLLIDNNMTFIDGLSASSDYCPEIYSNCEPTIVKETTSIIVSKSKRMIWLLAIPSILLLCVGVFFFIYFVKKKVDKRYRTQNFPRSVVIIQPFDLD